MKMAALRESGLRIGLGIPTSPPYDLHGKIWLEWILPSFGEMYFSHLSNEF